MRGKIQSEVGPFANLRSYEINRMRYIWKLLLFFFYNLFKLYLNSRLLDFKNDLNMKFKELENKIIKVVVEWLDSPI